MSDKSSHERLSDILAVQDPDELRRNIEAMPDDDVNKGLFFLILAEKFQSRFEGDGRVDVSDIDQAIYSCESAGFLAFTHSVIVLSRIFKGKALEARARYLRDPSGLQEGIDACRLAVKLSELGAAPDQLTRALLALASVCMARYELGDSTDLTDVEEAMASHRRVLELTPAEDPRLAEHILAYALSIIRRLRDFEDGDTLREACTWLRCAAELLPRADERKPKLLAILSIVLTRCFTDSEYHGDVDDIHDAIDGLVHALKLIPHLAPARSYYFEHLTHALEGLFRHCVVRDRDLGSFAQYYSAVDLLPQKHPLIQGFLRDLVVSFRERFAERYAKKDYDKAIIEIEMAITVQRRILDETMLDSLPIANGAGVGISRSKDVESLASLLDLRLKCTGTGSGSDLVGAAVARALEINDVTSALDWFDQGRATIWAQVYGFSTPIDELRKEFPDLAERFERTAQALDSAPRQDTPSHSLRQQGTSGVSISEAARPANDVLRVNLSDVPVGSTMLKGDDLESPTMHRLNVDERLLLVREYGELLDEIRGLERFQNFLRPKSKNRLSLVTLRSAVACINIHTSRCDALILCGSDLRHVPLPGLTPSLALEWQRTMKDFIDLEFARARKSSPQSAQSSPPVVCYSQVSNDGLLDILRRMWFVVVQPIFALLGWTDGGLAAHDRRIRWCTRGSLTFLPLHAAGPYDGSSFNACDIAVSSYTSTLDAVSQGDRVGRSTAPPSILVVAKSDATDCPPLLGTKVECENIKHHFSAPPSKFLEDAEATATAVLDNMSAHPYIHLACHGKQDAANPMDCAFVLHNSELTLRALMERSSRTGELAFLSACETSKGHEMLPDEAVHLAAGMLTAGYRSVVGTLWPIDDDVTPLVADVFYENLLKNRGVDGGLDVAYALHTATQAVRKKFNDRSVALWAAFVHFGL